MTKAERIELRKLWAERVSAFQASGQTTSAWCKAHNLKPHQLGYWLAEILDFKGFQSFLPNQYSMNNLVKINEELQTKCTQLVTAKC